MKTAYYIREYESDAINIMKDFGYYYELTPITLLLMICTIISIVSLVMISLWKLNIKFGRKGWVSLIPFYNLLCLSEDVLGKKIYILFLLIPIINIIFLMILFYNLAKVFGKTKAYRIFTIFFFIILVPFIAFDDSKYLGVEKKVKTIYK